MIASSICMYSTLQNFTKLCNIIVNLLCGCTILASTCMYNIQDIITQTITCTYMCMYIHVIIIVFHVLYNVLRVAPDSQYSLVPKLTVNCTLRLVLQYLIYIYTCMYIYTNAQCHKGILWNYTPGSQQNSSPITSRGK